MPPTLELETQSESGIREKTAVASSPVAPRAGAPRAGGAARGAQIHPAGSRATAVFRRLLGALAIVVVAVNVVGAIYYASPMAARVRDPLHAWLKPSGLIGQSLGILAASLFFFLWLYPLRKKYSSALSFTGKVGTWLDWHIVAGLMVPLLAATHAGWRFTGMVGLGYGAMFLVCLSGIVGRYVYVRIPRSRDGLVLSRDEIASERNRILFEFTAASGLRPSFVRETLGQESEGHEGTSLPGAFLRMIRDDLQRRRAVRAIEKAISRPGAPRVDRSTLRLTLKLARKEMALAQQARMLEATHRVFRYWHVIHRPFAVTALFAVVAHIAVAVIFRATWFY